MAERFGGKYSPNGKANSTPAAGGYRNARRSRVGGRVNLLFLAPLPLIFAAFGNGATALALNLAALGLLLLAAWLTREGLLAQEAYEARKVARRPAFPRKMMASMLTGVGLALAGFAASGGVFAPLIYGVIGTLLHGFSFGIDPLKNKGMEGINSYQSDRVARAIDEAEKHLTTMSAAINRLGERQLETRVAQFQTVARDLFRTVEEDPRDLTGARKYLSVYLMGARDAAVKFADLYGRTRDAKARTDFEALLTDLSENFSARTRKMLLDDRSDMNIEIEVLRERLHREGLRTRETLNETNSNEETP